MKSLLILSTFILLTIYHCTAQVEFKENFIVLDHTVTYTGYPNDSIPNNKQVKTYNIYGKVATDINYTWNNAWIKSTKTEYFYDANNYDTAYISSTWDSPTNNWIPSQKISYKYNENHKVETYTLFLYQNQKWCPYYLYKNYYGTSGEKISLLTSIYENNQWIRSDSVAYNYVNNLIDNSIQYNFANNLWTPKNKSTYSWDNENLIQLITFNFQNGSWIEISKTVNQFSSTNKVKTSKMYQWNGTWNLYYTLDYFYNQSDDIGYIITKIMTNSNVTISKTFYYYTTITTVENIGNKNIVLYPNPCKDIFYVNSEYSIISIELYSCSGIRIKTLHKNLSCFNISELNTGLYFVKLLFEDKTYTIKKLIKN